MSNPVRPWLDQAGAIVVEHIGGIPHFNIAVDLEAPRTGVLHTTEGDWTSSLAVFKTHYAPHFLLGFDAVQNKVRIAQLVQIGTIGAALVTHNDHAIVQVEMIGYSKQSLWLPDDPTLEALAALMAACKREYGIELTHPWPDGDYGLYGNNPHRSSGKWGVVGGWYGHGDVPIPDNHWDPGALAWSKVFARAAAMTDVLSGPTWTPPIEPSRLCAGDRPAPSAGAPSPLPTPTAPPDTVLPTWPPDGNVFFAHAAQIYNAWRDLGVSIPFALAMVIQAEFESAFKTNVVGDHDTAFNIYQWHWYPRGEIILQRVGVDVRRETSLKKIVSAAWWELNNTHTHARDAIAEATTAADASIAACTFFEGAGAPDAAQRRGLGAERWAAWVNDHAQFIAANPAQ